MNVEGSPKEDVSPSSSTPKASAALQDRLRSPRSVSTSGFPIIKRGPANQPGISGVPTVRATSPGAEFRNERIQAETRRQELEAKRKRLQEPISQFLPESVEKSGPKTESLSDSTQTHVASEKDETANSMAPVSGSPSAFPTSLRRFHISRPSTPLKGPVGTGVTKKGSTPNRARAILVEKLTRAPSLRGASVLQTLEQTADRRAEIDTVAQSKVTQPQSQPQEDSLPKRKRPVVNQAEKTWREQNKTSISAAKEHLTTKFEARDDLDKLAQELEEVMLDIDAEENQMDVSQETRPVAAHTPAVAPPSIPRSPLKFKPRHPGNRKTAVAPDHIDEDRSADKMHENESDDGEYVYDTYIRVPLHAVTASGSANTNQFPQPPSSDITGYKDPLAEANAFNGVISSDVHLKAYNIDPTRTDIGIVVITSDDEEIWDQYLEEDQDSDVDWDGDDVDSNGIPLHFPLHHEFNEIGLAC